MAKPKIIKLTNSSRQVLIDQEDFKRVALLKWHLIGKRYVAHCYVEWNYPKRTFQKMIKLHHYILGYPLFGLVIDHINRNPLDNRKSNLRIIRQIDNTRNHKLFKNNTSGYSGVGFNERYKKWVARGYGQPRKTLGYFKFKHEAINARKRYEKEIQQDICVSRRSSKKGLEVE